MLANDVLGDDLFLLRARDEEAERSAEHVTDLSHGRDSRRQRRRLSGSGTQAAVEKYAPAALSRENQADSRAGEAVRGPLPAAPSRRLRLDARLFLSSA